MADATRQNPRGSTGAGAAPELPRETLLHAVGLAKFYGPRLVFKDVSLTVVSGEVVLLAGANGAGKSTLARILAGISTPDRGVVSREAPPRKIGFLGHQPFLYPQLTALENLRFWADCYGVPGDVARLTPLLERVDLAPFAKERAGAFSRGMLQRLNLARVFLTDPLLLFLDEPGAGLDRRSAAVLREEIAQAKARGAGVVWVSHDFDSDLTHADRVLALAKRKTAFIGPAEAFEVECVC